MDFPAAKINRRTRHFCAFPAPPSSGGTDRARPPAAVAKPGISRYDIPGKERTPGAGRGEAANRSKGDKTMRAEQLQALLDSMTLEEKVGQLVQVNAGDLISNQMEITGPEGEKIPAEEINRTLGSVLTFENAAQAKALQEKHLAADEKKIPLLLMLVQFGGPSNGDYGRYMLPITAFIPFMAGMLLKLRNQKE